MKYVFHCFCLLFAPAALFSLEMQPWFGNVYEFNFIASYAYSRFHKVEGAKPQLTHPFNVNLIYSDLEFCISPQWDIDVDIQFADTTQQSFGFRTFGAQARYLWLDDVVGDPISLATGLSIRPTNPTSLHDVSCPSHSNVDFEANLAIGKEFSNLQFWRFRLWGWGAIGMANRGSPWVRGVLAVEGNYHDVHKWGIFYLGSHGYGRLHMIDPNHFDGYGKIRAKSIDLAFRYGYRMGVWGTIRFEYDRRVMAKLCPENVNTFIISYLVPFSF